MDKPFKTYAEQIKILSDRGMTIDESARDILMRENYYCVVNGYKDFFLDKTKSQETYREGVSFSDIHSLFLFDREFRFIFFRRILVVEATLKTIIAYRSAEQYPDDPEFYLNRDTYTKDRRMTNRVTSLLDDLQRQRQRNTPSLNHYRDECGYVPFWVLVKNVTFGCLSHFYDLLDRRGIKQRVVNDIKSLYFSECNHKLTLTVEELRRDLQIFTKFRNVCAHDERFYCYTVHQVSVGSGKPADVGYLFHALWKYIDQCEFKSFISEVGALLNASTDTKGIDSATLNAMINSMGM